MVEAERQFTLLLVDDNPTNVLLLVKIIEFDLPEVRVLTASSAREGLALAEQNNIDGAFIDVQMPQMDGLEMCRQLRSKPQTANIPLVLMTAHIASPEMRAEGLEVGAYDFISQPISNVEMLARIKVMLRLCQDEQRAAEQNQKLQQQLTDHTARLRWISGLLMSGNGSLAELDQQLLQHLANELPDPADIDEKQFFEKLVTEFPVPWQKTLLKLSLLDSIPVSLAQKLSEIGDVEAVFDYLSRHQLAFTEKIDGDGYLFLGAEIKTFLRARAKQTLTEDEHQQACLIAADWYRQRKDFAAALGVLISAEQYSAVSQLLSQIGLVLQDKDYSSRIAPLIDQIPAEVVASCGWLNLFRGINALQQLSTGAEDHLELAFQHFQATGDARGLLLTLPQQVYQTILFGRSFERGSNRLELFKQLAAEQLATIDPIERLKISAALGLAEFFFAGDLSAVEKILTAGIAEAQQLQLPQQQLELNLLRVLYALQQGRFLVVQAALEQGLAISAEHGSLFLKGLLHAAACSLLHDTGELEGLQQQAQILSDCCGHDIQKRTGISSMLGYEIASLLLTRGEREKALETIEIALLDGQSVNNLHMQSRLLQLRGWIKALSGQDLSAQSDLEAGLQLRKEIGGVFYYIENLLIAGSTCFALQQFEQASHYLCEGLAESEKYQEERFRTGLHAWLAVARKRCGDSQGANEQAQFFFASLKKRRAPFFCGLTLELVDELLPFITENQQRIVLQPLLEKQFCSYLDEDNRRMPLLKVVCLGRFQLQLGTKTFQLNQLGQPSRHIFALLVVAPNHSLSLELIMGLMWPDSPPHKARNSIDSAHSRLRKALEEKFGPRIKREYLILEKGMLSLRHIQIDVSLFDRAMESVRYHLQRDHFWQAEHALWDMQRIWNGAFLSGYDLDGELPLQREKMSQLRLEQLCRLAQLLQRRKQLDEAARLLQSGLSIDPTDDAIISQLLSLYKQQQDSRAVGLLLDNYRLALQNEEYEAEEIEELIEALGP